MTEDESPQTTKTRARPAPVALPHLEEDDFSEPEDDQHASSGPTPHSSHVASPTTGSHYLATEIVRIQADLRRLRRRQQAQLDKKFLSKNSPHHAQNSGETSSEQSFLQFINSANNQDPFAGTRKGTLEYYAIEIAFLFLITAAVVVIGFSSNSFFLRRAPSPTVDFFDYQSLQFPVVTVCSAENAIPYFPQADLLRPDRKPYDLTSFVLPNGTFCSRADSECYDAQVEQGWISDGSQIDCNAELSAMSVSRFSDRVSLANTPCRYCFRLSGENGRFATQSATNTEKLGLEIAEEFFDCIYRVNGLRAALLGTGRDTSSLNGRIRTDYRSDLRGAGVLQFGDQDLPPEAVADFDSDQMCNLLLFSGYFMPGDRSSGEPMYRWSPSESTWSEADDQFLYFRVLTEPVLEANRAFDLYLESPGIEIPFGALQDEGSIPMSETKRGPIIEAPRIRVGSADVGLFRFNQRDIIDKAEYSWRAVSYPATLPEGSLLSCIAEYGYTTLAVEHYYYESRGDIFAYLENQLGWMQIFTGLSIYTIILKPVRHWARRRKRSGE